MNLRSTTSFVAVVGLALAGITGCGPSGPKTHPVTGVVTLDGSPVENAVVSFHPAAGEGRSASGTTDTSGRFELSTLARGDGAMEGKYRITVAKYQYPDGSVVQAPDPDAPPPESLTDEEFEEVYEEDDDVDPVAVNVLPQKYSNPAMSGFEADVVPGENTFDLELSTGG